MMKRKNTGFSMVEILISVAIFAILMIPIVSGIVSSLKMSTGAKELQYRNEFAENMMEHIKSVPIEEMQKEDYYVANGVTSYTTEEKSSEVEADWDSDGNPDETLNQKKYTMKGKVKLGTQKTEYYYQVDVDNQYYVDKRVNDAAFIDPNNLALGVVEDIDYTKVALIDGTILNYDLAASTALKSRKLLNMKEMDETGYWQQMEGTGNDLLEGDIAYRLVRIEVTGDATNGYKVRCVLTYWDTSNYLKPLTAQHNDYDKVHGINDSSLDASQLAEHLNYMELSNRSVSYVPYAQTFKELPNIYLMYNPCYYYKGYTKDDYVVLDTSGITDSTKPEVNLFMVEIAETYSQNLLDSAALAAGSDAKILYRTDQLNGIEREDVNIHLAAVAGVSDDLKNINVYHNIGDNFDDAGNSKINLKTASEKLWYKNSTMIESSEGVSAAVDTNLQSLIKADYGEDSTSVYKLSALVDSSTRSANVGLLNTAEEENRGLYEVKIWLKETSNGEIDTTKEQPILRGTKGGNES